MQLFFLYILIVPCIYGNWLGVLVGFVMILGISLGLFMRSIMTKLNYEKILRLTCILSLASTSCAILEKIVIYLLGQSYNTQRISAVFFHPNYFGTIVATVIIICAYKVLTRQGQMWLYYVIALVNVISLYLCESMFAWVEVFLGIAILLIIQKKHRLLALWFLAAAIASFFIFDLNLDIIPRLSDVEVTIKIRLKIWRAAVNQIKHSLLFGHGFMSFLFNHQSYYQKKLIAHSHSIYLEMLLNFGLVGSGILISYLVRFYKTIVRVCFTEKKTSITSLILAVSIAALVHGITDVTLLWIQTLPLFLIVLAGIGVYEKKDTVKETKSKNI